MSSTGIGGCRRRGAALPRWALGDPYSGHVVGIATPLTADADGGAGLELVVIHLHRGRQRAYLAAIKDERHGGIIHPSDPPRHLSSRAPLVGIGRVVGGRPLDCRGLALVSGVISALIALNRPGGLLAVSGIRRGSRLADLRRGRASDAGQRNRGDQAGNPGSHSALRRTAGLFIQAGGSAGTGLGVLIWVTPLWLGRPNIFRVAIRVRLGLLLLSHGSVPLRPGRNYPVTSVRCRG